MRILVLCEKSLRAAESCESIVLDLQPLRPNTEQFVLYMWRHSVTNVCQLKSGPPAISNVQSMTMATLMLRVFHAGRLEATTRRAVSGAGFSCRQRRPGAGASFFGGWRRTGALTAAGVWLLAAVGALGQGTATVTLAWDPSPSPTVAGYNVYYGTASLAYTYEQSAGAATSATVPGLLPGTTYYFAVTALDAAGDESIFSNEVSYTVPGTAPTVSNPSNQGVTGNSPTSSLPSNSGLPNQPGTPAPGTGPIISSIPDQVVDENSTLAPLPFTVTDAQFPSSSLSFSATSSNPVLVPAGSIGFSGDGTGAMVSVSPALGQVGSTSITLSVSDGVVSNSTSFVLTVTPPPGIALTSPQAGSAFVAPASNHAGCRCRFQRAHALGGPVL